MKKILILASIAAVSLAALGQGTAFTYQGRLTDGASAANGSYDLACALFNTNSAGTQQGSTVTNSAVAVSNGLFTIQLDFGNQFPGAARWLEIGVRTNGGSAFTTLTPRQQVTATPYAVTASNLSGTLPAAQLSGAIANANLPASPTVSGTMTANTFSGNGVGVTNVNAASLNGLNASNFWQLGGNSISGAQFLGSTNNQAVEIRVNGARALRLEPNTNGAPNVIGGASVNFVAPGVSGAVVGGGGASNYFGIYYTNSVAGNFGSIGGGAANTVLSSAQFSTIGGGYLNSIQANAQSSIIGGGEQNFIQAVDATIGGGAQNLIQAGANDATISGGFENTNQANASATTIGGGFYNTIQSNATYATISGGRANTIQNNAIESTIGGGSANTIQSTCQQATINGGNANTIGGRYSTIGGGINNTVGSGGDSSTVSGGNGNLVSIAAVGATIGGGFHNLIDVGGFAFGNNFTTIGGGENNVIQSSAYGSTIAGGSGNRTSFGGEYSSIGGGTQNTNTGEYATIPGGSENVAANHSFAAGWKAKAVHDGAFVWADTQGANFSSTALNQFLIRAAGGVGINTNDPGGAALAVNGSAKIYGFNTLEFGAGVAGKEANAGKIGYRAFSASSLDIVGAGTSAANRTIQFFCEGGATFTGPISSPSDRNLKRDFAALDSSEVLAKVAALPIQSWAYKYDDSKRHIGPVAQDFHSAFGLNGSDDTTIATVDADGVALAAIQGLNKKLEEQKIENAQMKRELAELRAMMHQLAQPQVAKSSVTR